MIHEALVISFRLLIYRQPFDHCMNDDCAQKKQGRAGHDRFQEHLDDDTGKNADHEDLEIIIHLFRLIENFNVSYKQDGIDDHDCAWHDAGIVVDIDPEIVDLFAQYRRDLLTAPGILGHQREGTEIQFKTLIVDETSRKLDDDMIVVQKRLAVE